MNTPAIALGARLTAVKLKNSSGEEIGKVIEWLMDVEQGRVVYVVAELYQDQAYYAIPWGVMKADVEKGGYITEADKVKRLPVDQTLINELVTDKNFLNQMYDTYQLPKYWQENSQASGSSFGESEGKAGNEAAQANEGKGYGG